MEKYPHLADTYIDWMHLSWCLVLKKHQHGSNFYHEGHPTLWSTKLSVRTLGFVHHTAHGSHSTLLLWEESVNESSQENFINPVAQLVGGFSVPSPWGPSAAPTLLTI
jgi:hypothetical protein